MSKHQDSIATNELIIEMAKINDWQSRDDLVQKTKKPQKTIITYLEKDNDISSLIERDNRFFETVNRRTGKAEISIIKYRLKSGLSNLLAVLDYLTTEKQRELLKTKYYQDHYKLIQEKLDGVVKLPLNDVMLNNILSSPVAVYLILRLNPENIEHLMTKSQEVFKKDFLRNFVPGFSKGFKYVKTLNIGTGFILLVGLYELAIIDNLTNNPDFLKTD